MEVIKVIALLIDKTARLYSIPDWSNEKSVDLAEWIYNNYNCEMIGTIQKTLENPPTLGKPIWRLTPDTIREWMVVELEKVCDAREQEVRDFKRLEREKNIPVELVQQAFNESDEFDQEESKFKSRLRRIATWLKINKG